MQTISKLRFLWTLLFPVELLVVLLRDVFLKTHQMAVRPDVEESKMWIPMKNISQADDQSVSMKVSAGNLREWGPQWSILCSEINLQVCSRML